MLAQDMNRSPIHSTYFVNNMFTGSLGVREMLAVVGNLWKLCISTQVLWQTPFELLGESTAHQELQLVNKLSKKERKYI